MRIVFNRPHVVGTELAFVQEAIDGGHLSGDGRFTKRCNEWLEQHVVTKKALLTHSCTAALEMAALLLRLSPGDEVILPSYTFVSTANAVVLRGAVPVFVDIRKDTLNIDETLIEAAITPRTKAIFVVHYAGVGCEMDVIGDIAARHHLPIVEDAAQGLLASYRGRPLGSMGVLGAFSFHETKNVISGEGGALVVNDEALVHTAEIMREKGTNRSSFFRGEVDKYTWVDVGSSYLPSEIIAAFLAAQLDRAEALTARRLELWNRYDAAFAPLAAAGVVRRPIIPAHCTHNAHMFYLLFHDEPRRSAAIQALRSAGIHAVFHYVPLHSSPAGQKFGRTAGALPVTDRVADTLLRLPLYVGLDDAIVDEVARIVTRASVTA